jgi:hypothetical protein
MTIRMLGLRVASPTGAGQSPASAILRQAFAPTAAEKGHTNLPADG